MAGGPLRQLEVEPARNHVDPHRVGQGDDDDQEDWKVEFFGRKAKGRGEEQGKGK